MTAPEKKSEYVVDKSWKQFICQASHCEYNDRRSHCLHEWMELDDHGICIFLSAGKTIWLTSRSTQTREGAG